MYGTRVLSSVVTASPLLKHLVMALIPVLFAVALIVTAGSSASTFSSLDLAPSAIVTVNMTGDGANLITATGCDVDTVTPGEQCTLRAAIQRVEALAGDDTIRFNIPTTQPNCNAGTGACIINLSTALPNLGTSIAVEGPGASLLTVRRDAVAAFRIFRVTNSSGIVSLSGLRMENGNADLSGGGAIEKLSPGTLNLVGCVIAGNGGGRGGGISNSNGIVNITNSLIFNNAVRASGGGIENSTGTVNVTNSSISSNSAALVFASGRGGGIYNDAGTVNISNSTITQNRVEVFASDRGPGVFGTATVKSSIIAGNIGFDLSGAFTSGGFNLIGVVEQSTGFNSPTDQTGNLGSPLDPRLDADQTGMILTPRCNSPVLDKGTSLGLGGPLTTDQRGIGFPRIIDTAAIVNAADGADIGAFERQRLCTPLTSVVNTTGDADDVIPGDAACDSDGVTAGNQCTLRAAMTEAEANTGLQTINFSIPTTDPGYDPVTGRYTINVPRALPEIINTDLVINGLGWDRLTVRRSTLNFYRIFTFGANVRSAAISGMTISNGRSSENGGGILQTDGLLSITACEISGNHADKSGGGISSLGSLRVLDSFVNGNRSDGPQFSLGSCAPNGGGGGIAVNGSVRAGNTFEVLRGIFNNNVTQDSGGGIETCDALTTISDTTFTDNYAAGRGGGLSARSAQRETTVAINNSEFATNRAGIGGGLALRIDSFDPGIASTTLFKSTIRNNFSELNGRGGGINIFPATGSTYITESTITGNTGPIDSPGIQIDSGDVPNFAPSGPLNVVNSTISGNTGDGIFLFRAHINILNSTISNNGRSGISGGGIGNPGTWRAKSSIIAANGVLDVTGAWTSGGFNLIGNPGTAINGSGFVNGVNSDQVGSPAAPLNPQLDPNGLQNNGGPTKTILLLPTSPAIDKGIAGGLTTDQRGVGFGRTFDNILISPASGGDNTDIGAIEMRPAPPTPTPTATPTNTPTATPTPTTTATPTVTPTATPKVTPTHTPTTTPTGTPTATPTPGGGLEGDISPRPNGDGMVLSNDVIQVRRFATGLDVLNPAFNEQQRADCAPRGTLGDGSINSGDVVQARRYATGLDPVTNGGGPASPLFAADSLLNLIEGITEVFLDREVRVGSREAIAGKDVSVPIEVMPFGDETAMSLTLEYDATMLADPRVILGEFAPVGSVLTVNTIEPGRIAVLIDSTESMTASAVPVSVVTITFEVAANSPRELPISLTSSIAGRTVSDSSANLLRTRYTNGKLTVRFE
ncbi:MAG: choice-of-anchor Q domain-containing protein [Pyrinomonadaceae bacterium]